MQPSTSQPHPRAPWRDTWHGVIFGHETFAGRLFDLILLTLILLSVLTVLLESVRSIRESFGPYLRIAEWTFTALFTIEYIARLISATNARRYARSFFGVVDLLAVAPVYLSFLFGVAHSFTVVRSLRLLRVFRILKLTEYVGAALVLRVALKESLRKITIFLFVVLTIVIIVGAMMYQIEGEANGFTSIPIGIYWAIVTLTTVGFGDITPKTPLGQALASMVMITGYGIIAVPTGIVTAEIARHTTTTLTEDQSATRLCPHCFTEGHDRDARFCKHCGGALPRPSTSDIS